ncbi:MAG: UvrD-helicase domain-containing protein, partial [Armatimonadetes bacterium]|nr:UvrD-helicase domain-containing protein [Armatimonadota bacterium]
GLVGSEMCIRDSLNPQQREAAIAVDGPVLIFAGAGSGKTRVLTYRLAYLVRYVGVPPQEILAVTFTNKAADEMKARIAQLVGERAALVTAGTFHSICARLLRIDGEAIGVPRNFVVFDEGDQLSLVRAALSALNYDPKLYKPADVLNAISRAKNELLGPEEYRKSAKGPFEKVVAAVYRRYQAALAENRALDFDDLINKAVELLQTQPAILEKWQRRWRYILVDEYQDINDAQYRFVHLLASGHRNICVVGDDDQSIYGWRGANVTLILRFHQDYPEAKVVYLEQNYRSTKKILECANAVIAHNEARAPKKLWTANSEGENVTVYGAINETEEAEWTVEVIRDLVSQGRRYGDVAILYRTNAMSRHFEEALMEAGVPYRIVGGVRFYDRAEIKDVVAYLRVAHNPNDNVSAQRILMRPPRGIGEKTAALVSGLAGGQGISLLEACRRLAQDERIRPGARHALADFVGLIEYLTAQAETASVSAMARLAVEKTGYLAWLQGSSSAEQLSRAENVQEFVSLAADYEERHPHARLPDFLEYVALMSDIDEAGEIGNQVALMTLHSAKGLEFPVVVMVGLEEGTFPHERSLGTPAEEQEERRLCYVGMTRAKELLYLTYCRYRTIYGTRTPRVPSRFLADLPPTVVTWVGERPDSTRRAGIPEPLAPSGLSVGPVVRVREGKLDLVSLVDSARKRREGRVAPATAEPKRVIQPTSEPTPASNADKTGSARHLHPGAKVRHHKFGEGTVFSVEGEGNDAVITVIFASAGIRKLAAQYARLEMLG